MKRISFALLFVLFCFTIHAQNKDIDKKIKGFDEFATKAMKDWNVQGLAVAVVQKDKVILAKGYGYRNVEQKLPVTAETLFAIGSCSKAFTAAGVCLLHDDGKLDMEKPLRDYLPAFKLYDEYATNNMTPRDLLCHRSGLPRHDLLWYGSSSDRKELLSRLAYLEPNKPFRSTYQYQNLMFMTAGVLIEELSGKSWEAFTKERILAPLEMTATNFSINDLQKAKDFSLGYTENKGKVEVIPYMNIDGIGPAGSINSNAKEMSNWVTALIMGGKFKGKAVLPENTVKQIQTPSMFMPAQVPLQYEETFYNMYGLGWVITSYRGHVRIEHGGNIDGFSASTSFMPKDSIGVVVLVNMNGSALPSIIRNNLLDRMLGLSQIDWNKRLLEERNKAKAAQENTKKEDDANRVKETKPSHPLPAYTGAFEHPGYGIVQIKEADDRLSITFNQFNLPLEHYHYDIFEIKDERFGGTKLSFNTSLKGEVDQISIKLEPAVKEIVFARKLIPKNVEITTLAKYIGEYDFGGQVAKVYLKNEKTMFLLVPGQPEYELVPVKEHEFKIKILEGFNVKFEVDSSGRATDLLSIQPNGTFRAKRK